jgi:hypothetical protein
MNETMKAGFTYLVEVVSADGTVTDSEVVTNLMPTAGINHTLGVLLKGEAQVSTWYIGLYEGNYTPTSSDVMATFPVAATETVAYTASTRLTFTSGTVTAGGVDNSSNKAEFTFNATKTVYGGFISSASAKSSTSGTLLSVVRFGSPKSVDSGSVLRVTAGFTMASA